MRSSDLDIDTDPLLVKYLAFLNLIKLLRSLDVIGPHTVPGSAGYAVRKI